MPFQTGAVTKQPPSIKLSREKARTLMVQHHGLARYSHKKKGALPTLLRQLRCIQLDPLDRIGTNADLVALARVSELRRGEIYEALLPGHAFEHFAKERCLLPAESFPWYRLRAAETPWWRLSERVKRLPKGLVESVLEEIRLRGPITVQALEHRGAVTAIDWSGWKGTTSATRMAIEVLWTRCQVVVCGRKKNTKLFDIPERALPHWNTSAPGEFETWAIRERAAAAGLLSRNSGPVWSMLSEARTSKLPQQLIDRGELCEVTIDGSPRRYLASPEFLKTRSKEYDGDVRILGPLDPLIWDRPLTKEIFGFDYVWEVYKPEHQRKWGWYVCPLLRQDQLIGRMDAEIKDGKLHVHKLWREGKLWNEDAVDRALERHARACGVDRVIRKKAIS